MMSGTRGLPFKPTLRWLPGKKPTIFFTNFTPDVRVSIGAKQIIADPSHPRHYFLKRKYEARDPKSLWLAPMVTLGTSPKRTVRTWCTRRLRAALKEEFAARGLNELGQRMRDGKAIEGPAVVWGTLVMQVTQKMITAKYEQVREEAGWTADALLAAFRPTGNSRPPPKAAGGRFPHDFPKDRGTAGKARPRQHSNNSGSSGAAAARPRR